jgi:hypothetical protein
MKTITKISNPTFALFTLACFALSPQAHAQCPQICDGNMNTALGNDALLNNTGLFNTAIGFDALSSNTTGPSNTAIGFQALFSNTTGILNTATGVQALGFNTTGNDNTASGFGALFSNTTASNNTATGYQALSSNTTASLNTATGAFALFDNTTGGGNTATGANTLVANTTGNSNTATGFEALLGNSIGNFNTATGSGALVENTTGNDNTANGFAALVNNTTGNFNMAMGGKALYNNTTGSSNIAVGFRAGELIDGSSNIDVGNVGVAGESGTIRIGTVARQTSAYVAGISGVTVPGGIGVIIDSSGHLGTTTSSARFKDDVQPMDKASEAILALKPVTFRYKHELDPKGIPQFGLVAEDVEKVNPALVARDEQGKPYTVRNEAVNAMLLNEFLKEHKAFLKEQCKVEEQGAMIAQQQRQIEALTATVQKVSAQLEVSKPVSQTIAKNQ